MYEQLLLHFFGDFISQNEWIASNKRQEIVVTILHSIIYALPFCLITSSILAIVLICITHILIDRYEPIKWLNRLHNSIFETDTGLMPERPDYFTYWLLFWQDATLHLICNYFILKWL